MGMLYKLGTLLEEVLGNVGFFSPPSPLLVIFVHEHDSSQAFASFASYCLSWMMSKYYLSCSSCCSCSSCLSCLFFSTCVRCGCSWREPSLSPQTSEDAALLQLSTPLHLSKKSQHFFLISKESCRLSLLLHEWGRACLAKS